MPTKVMCVAGARPNFPKIAPLMRVLSSRPEKFIPRLIHTGQHYDDALSKVFFDELAIPRPDMDLGVGSASHAVQTAEILKKFEQVLRDEQPHVVLVVGDVNSTIACTLAASKFFLDKPFRYKGELRRRPVTVHVEAGLRSFDDDMPEEINRRLTDCVSDMLFITDPAGERHLIEEGIHEDRRYFVGNVMIDTLLAARDKAMSSDVLERFDLKPGDFALLTLHRPSNVDDLDKLRELVDTLDRIAHELRIVFPVHPRTQKRLEQANLTLDDSRWLRTGPLGYLDFMKLEASAKLILTDSGGIQEESTVLGVPCLTLRENTERPVTIDEGTNILAGTSREGILQAYESFKQQPKTGRVPRFWDGRAAERIVDALATALS